MPRSEPVVFENGRDLPILRERRGTFSSINRRLRLVVHDSGTLATLPLDIGPVDFEREMVLLVAMGPTPSDEYAVRIHRIWRDGQELRVGVDRTFPAADSPRRSVTASPYHLVVVPKCRLNVRGFTVAASPDQQTDRWRPAG